MLLPIKPICPKAKIRKDGTSIVFLQYCGTNDKKTLLNTGIAIPPKYWSKRSNCISETLPDIYGSTLALNEQLLELSRRAEDIIKHGNKAGVMNLVEYLKRLFSPECDLASLSEALSNTEQVLTNERVPYNVSQPTPRNFDSHIASSYLKPISSLDFFGQFDDYMNTKKNKVTPGMMKVYNNAKGLLMAYEQFKGQKITFDCFDYNFYDSFVDFLTFDYEQRRKKVPVKGLKLNSIGKTIKQLRIFLRDRARRKIIPPIDLTDFKIVSEDADAIYLSSEEIARIYRTGLHQTPYLEYYRDLLVLGCLTGLRFSDFASIQPEDIKGDMLRIKQKKSDAWVVIPLRPIAYEILVNKYRGIVPATTNPEFNRHIKTIGLRAGITEQVKFSYKKGNQDIVVRKHKYEWITSHTCRRSFCTNEFLAGTPAELIMKISGHKSLRDFYRYIRISPEEAGNKLKEIWNQRRTQEVG